MNSTFEFKSSNKASLRKPGGFFGPSTIQPKLTIGQPNDKYEQEADTMADKVMRMPQNRPGIQKKCASCEKEERVQRMGQEDQEDTLQTKSEIQKMESDEENMLQTKPLMMKSEGGGGVATSALSSQLNRSKGGGLPLPTSTNRFMSKAFGNDFSNVRVHTGSNAAQMNQGLNASAFTHGADIYFNKGQYSPDSSAGKRLLGHELTHVVQQGAGKRIQRKTCGFSSPLPSEPVEGLLGVLGSPPINESFSPSNEQLQCLYQYLKRVRKNEGKTNEVFEKKWLSALEQYFPGTGESIWRESQGVFAGYSGTAAGKQARGRMKKAKELGLDQSTKRGFKAQFLDSDVLFFSGHHYGSPNYGSEGGHFDAVDIRGMRSGGNRSVFSNVKLIMVSSCSVLRKSALPFFRSRFPNALILGWMFSAPYNQNGMMKSFLSKLPPDLILEDSNDINLIIQNWEAFVENLEKEGVKMTTSRGGRASKSGLGYATSGGTVKYMRRQGTSFGWRVESR